MNKTTYLLAAVILFMLAFTASGCVTTRRIIAFSDHEVSPVTKIETFKLKRFGYLYLSSQHEFWICKDEGDVLRCDKKCGDDAELKCPPYISYAGGTTHTRSGGGNVAAAPAAPVTPAAPAIEEGASE